MGDGPRVCTVVSCGEKKQDLGDGETVPARELYDSAVHTCKDRYGSHSHAYYIASAKYRLVHHERELPEYDQTLEEMGGEEVRAWADDVARNLRRIVDERDIDAVVIVAGETYVDPLEPHFDAIDAKILTPWQSEDEVTGNGKGMSWCNDEENWPENVERVEEIATVVSDASSA